MSDPLAPMEDVDACAVCGSTAWAVRFEEPPYSVRRCPACGLTWVSPRHHAGAIASVYGAEYWRSDSPKTKGYADYRGDARLYLKTFERRQKLVSRYVPAAGRALDIGCAAGYFLQVLADAGFDVFGVELSSDIARAAQDRVGADRIHVGTIETASYRSASFDLVTMWDVVEHVPDPVSLLRSARALLKPDGVLLVETQNIDSAFARLLGRRWHHFKHEEHLFHFNRSSLAALLRRADFTVERVTPWFAGKYVSLSFIAERSARVHPMISRAMRPLSTSSAALYVNLLDEMVAIARPAP